MQVDLVLNPFEAAVPQMVEAAVAAESTAVDGVWVADHFSGAVVGSRWSRDPFVCLGAIAAATDRVRVGPLVANVRNRHAAQLASAINSIASLAPGRVVLGMGSGAAPGSRFAVEHDAIGTELGDAPFRRSLLVDDVHAVRHFHHRTPVCHCGIDMEVPLRPHHPHHAITDGAPCPPIVVGASARATVEIAIQHADGVNLRAGPRVVELVELVRAVREPSFEVSVLDGADVTEATIDSYRETGVDRLVIGVDLRDGADAVREFVNRLPVP